MTEMASGGTLGDLLAARRRRRLVGRTSEVELFRVALESPEPQFLLLYLHGPPGIGKRRCSMSLPRLRPRSARVWSVWTGATSCRRPRRYSRRWRCSRCSRGQHYRPALP